jgi:hypothetical protein
VTRRQLVAATIASAIVWAGFAAGAAWRSPIPGVNEPHYLCKARHFCDRSWCERDLFLSSTDAHWLFFAAIGPLTRVLNFEQAAWIGRITVWGLLAFGWARLIGQLVPGRWSAVWSAAIFQAIQATGNLSGEWLIGGVEAKGFSYAALLFAIAAACRKSWAEAGAAGGIAIAFHPVVGIWGIIALAAAAIAGWASQPVGRSSEALHPAVPAPQSVRDSSVPQLFGWRQLPRRFLPVVLCIVCSLPGLIPAVALLAKRPTPNEARIADETQVFYRLKHHLDPNRFSTRACWSYAGMLVGWLALRRLAKTQPEERLFARFVLATGAIAAGGFAVGLWLRSPAMMKFYPFRLCDVFLPIAVSVTAAGLLERIIVASAGGRRTIFIAGGHLLACAALAWSFVAPGRATNPSRWPHERWSAFVDACKWIKDHTPADAVFLTPRENVGFKWYAERAEYFTRKDCPQDAAGILEWGRRHNRVERMLRKTPKRSASQFTGTVLADFARQTQVGYVLATGTPPKGVQPLYENETFSVFVIRPARE